MNPFIQPDSGSDELPVLHRLAIAYLVLPLVIWLVGWFEWWFGFPSAVLLVLGLWRVLSGSWQIKIQPVTVALLLIAFAWVMMTAAGGVLDVGNFDWDKHRAVLLDLARGDWPTYLPAYFEAPLLLRYYLGYYMVPGLIGSWFGPAVLNWIVPIWTWGGTALTVLLFTRGLYGWKAVAAAVMLIFFATIALSFEPLEVGWGRTMLVEFMFSPQHFIAGALNALLIVQLRRDRRFLPVCGVILAATMFWSALIALGMLVFLAILLFENGIRPFLSWQNLLLSAPLLGLLVVYLSSGANSIPSGWIWDRYGWDGIASTIGMPRLAGFLLLAVLLLLLRPRLRRDPLFLSCLFVPLIIPWYSFGLLNEYLRYASLGAFILLCYYCAQIVLTEWGSSHKWMLRSVLVGLTIVLLGGFVSPLMNLAQGAPTEGFRVLKYENLGADLATVLNATGAQYHDQYATYAVPDWFRRLLRGAGAEPLDRGELIIESEYDVYLNGKELIYVRTPCSEEETDTRFILFVYPVNAALLEGREHDNQDFWFFWHGKRIGGVCIATRTLPDYEIDHFRTGQYIGTYVPTGELWIVDYQVK